MRGEVQRRPGAKRSASGREDLGAPVGAAACAAGPQWRPISIAHAERHQRTAVVEVDADPVPPGGVLRHHLARPLVVEPRPPLDVARATADDDAAAYRELRPAVIPARLAHLRPLARIALLSLQKDRLRRLEREVEREFARGDLRDIALALERERPVADPRAGRRLVRPGKVEHRARRALVVAEPALRGLGQRRVREHQLTRREVARVVLGDARPIAKERDLNAERLAVARAHPAGHVPPLVAVRGVAAVIARESQRLPRQHLGIPLRPARRHRRGEHRQCEERAPLHQSSLTARTASAPIACRPESTAVSVARAIDREAEEREVAPRHGELHAPVERLAIDDVDQDQADRRPERGAHADPQSGGGRAFGGEHRADLPARHAEMAQHAELPAPRDHQRAERGRQPDEPDRHRGELERVGHRERAVERRERQRADLAGKRDFEALAVGNGRADRVAHRCRVRARRKPYARRWSRCGRRSGATQVASSICTAPCGRP